MSQPSGDARLPQWLHPLLHARRWLLGALGRGRSGGLRDGHGKAMFLQVDRPKKIGRDERGLS